MAQRRVGRYPRAFRQMAVERLKQCDNIVALSQELGVSRRLLYTWREKLEPVESGEGPPATLRESTLRKEVSRLKRVLAEKVLEVAFFQRCLAQRRGATPAERQGWRAGIYDQIRDVMSRQGGLRIERMCQLAPVSRAGFYRSLQEAQPMEEEMAVRSEIQQIALAHRRRYGYRRSTAELRRREPHAFVDDVALAHPRLGRRARGLD